MIFGISSYTYTWAIGVADQLPQNPMNEQDLLEIAAKNNLRLVQIADNLPLHCFDDERLNELITTATKLNIAIEPGAKGLTKNNLEQYIEISQKLKSPILRFVIDDTDYQPDLEEVIKVVQTALPKLQSNNITLAIENHDRFKAAEFEYIIKSCNSPNVGICLDTVNSLGAGEDVMRVTEVLAPYTVNFHIKEFVIRRHFHKMGFTVTGCPLGKGMLPLNWILQKLDKEKCKTAILEQWTAPEDTLSKTIEKERIWTDESIEYLKSKI